jgi:hypothetical protein
LYVYPTCASWLREYLSDCFAEPLPVSAGIINSRIPRAKILATTNT